MMPPLVDATVVSQDPDRYRLYVSLDVFGGQIPFLPVDVLTHGQRDAVRGDFPPLPLPGTRGLVAFTRGDDRTGRWIGAQSPALPDASTLTPGNGNIRYRADYAGGWSWSGADGAEARVFADGGSVLLGASLPAPTRHVLASGGARVPAPFGAAQRNPLPPAAFPLAINLANGFTVLVNGSGGAQFIVPAGQTISFSVAGGPTMILSSTGLTVSAEITAGFGTGDSVTLQQHKHGTGTAAAGTSVPTPGT